MELLLSRHGLLQIHPGSSSLSDDWRHVQIKDKLFIEAADICLRTRLRSIYPLYLLTF